MGAAEEHWAAQLAGWAIPDEILAQASADPWKLTPNLFPPSDPAAGPPDDPSFRTAREALGDGGTVIDVGVGSGAASLRLAPLATLVTGVDVSEEMLKAFTVAAKERGVKSRFFEGRWPDNGRAVPPADVVVCHHAFYNVPDLAAFALALTSHARRRVVVELGQRHPISGTNPLWARFWGLERPERPVADDAVSVMVEAGIDAQVEREERGPWRSARDPMWVEHVTRRLCLPPEREAEVAEALAELPEAGPRVAVTLWWDGAASG